MRTVSAAGLCESATHGDIASPFPWQEPKLDMARRVVSGELFSESWVELDSEIARFEAAQLHAIAGNSTVSAV